MSSVEIFNSGTNLLITLVALIILMLSVWYSSQDIKIGKGIRYLFVGLVLEFIGSWFGYQMNEYYQLVYRLISWPFLSCLSCCSP